METFIVIIAVLVYVLIFIGASIHLWLISKHNNSLKGILRPAKPKLWVKIFFLAHILALFYYAYKIVL